MLEYNFFEEFQSIALEKDEPLLMRRSNVGSGIWFYFQNHPEVYVVWFPYHESLDEVFNKLRRMNLDEHAKGISMERNGLQ